MPSRAHVFGKPKIGSFRVVVFAEDGKEMYQNGNARAERLFLLINLLFCGVLVAIAVLVAKVSATYSEDLSWVTWFGFCFWDIWRKKNVFI